MEALSRRMASKLYAFYFIHLGKKRGRKPSRAALVFSHAGKRGGKMNIYVIYEYLNEKWHQRNVFNSYKKAVDFIFQAREWEKRWKEQGFEYAPQPGIYKIVRFEEKETFSMENTKGG